MANAKRLKKSDIVFITIIGILLIIVVFLLLSCVPVKREVYKTMEGIAWNVDTEEYETVNVQLSGHYYDYILELFNHVDSYQGTFEISVLDDTKESNPIDIILRDVPNSDYKRAYMWYVSGSSFSGNIVTDSKLSTMRIDYTLDNQNYIIAFPAKDFGEAKELADKMDYIKLLNKSLNN